MFNNHISEVRYEICRKGAQRGQFILLLVKYSPGTVPMKKQKVKQSLSIPELWTTLVHMPICLFSDIEI